MLTVVLGAAAIAVVTLLIGVMCADGIMIWVSVGACVTGLVILAVDAWRARRRGDTGSNGVSTTLPIDHRETAGNVVFSDHLLERDLVREDEVHALDTDPMNPDATSEAIAEDPAIPDPLRPTSRPDQRTLNPEEPSNGRL